MTSSLACICNIIHPCRNEISGTFVLVQWLIAGIAAVVRIIRPVLLILGLRGKVELREEDYNKTWMYIPNGEGDIEVAYLVEPPPEIRGSVPSLIQFEYYKSEPYNTSTALTVNFAVDEAIETLLRSRQERDMWQELVDQFNPQLDTKMLVHGWKSSTRSRSIKSMREAYTKRGQVNVFAINWRDQADNIYYLKPARYAIHVGRAVASLIDLLVETKDADSLRIHLIGHSLGAHIMGYAGSYTKYRVGRITGLDPARPAFEDCIGPENHLDTTDAEFVDIIHSCAGVLGFKKPIGSVDFYPNGGKAPQPGCNELSQVFAGCSHGRSHEFYAESINSEKGFNAAACDTIKDMQTGNCNGSCILMGDPVPSTARGIYFVKTADKPNFALGPQN